MRRSKGDPTASENIDLYVAEIADWRGDALKRIREAFREADPAIVEEWKWMGSPAWSREGLIAVANAHKGKVKLTFSQGAHLPDPDALFNAGLGGKQWRAIDLHEGDVLDESALQELVRSAVRFNQSNKKRRKSR